MEDLAVCDGQWMGACVERVNGEGVVLSYSYGSVKEPGTFGSSAWHVKGCTMRYPRKEYLGHRALSSGRVELMYTLRCLSSIRLEGWTGVIHLKKNAIAKIPSLCAVSTRAAVLDLVVDEEAGGVVERTALGWILASQKNPVFSPVW